MTNEPNFSDTSTFIGDSQDLQFQPAQERDCFLEERENTSGQLDDRTIIWRFAQGKKRLVVNQNLRIDYAHNSLQLSTPGGELIAIHKVAKKLHYILVKKDSKYSQTIQEIISECQFIPIDAVTAERGFMRYQKYDIPEHYTLHYELADRLWQMWQDSQQPAAAVLGLDILILARSKWYRIQQMICTDERLDLQTRLGLISLSLRDRIAWIAKVGDVGVVGDADLGAQNGANGGTDSDILGKIISKLAIETMPDGDVNSAPSSDLPSSVFSQSDDTSLLYDGQRSGNLMDNEMSPSQQLLASTMSVLENYLEHGETIVRTETIVDPQGNIISEKTISTHRGCPRWAIEAIVNWS
ncbi:hypothetical protein [Chamaesiphon sp. OTE_20_metabat_361]|uniref:hypothetical protein n=1 Tax=Chamaesiphon sp. OTE_20_metabat_361 TaxID=2964689 RepID=UPI00286BBAB1|nr:hypothetical protein [Chamaesiphon sp. OTE_20_metabat_361]